MLIKLDNIKIVHALVFISVAKSVKHQEALVYFFSETGMFIWH